MKLRTVNQNHQDDGTDDGFPDPADAVPGLIPPPEEVPLPEGEVAMIVAEPAPELVRETSRLDVLLHLGVGAVLMGFNSASKRLQEKQSRVVVSPGGEEPLSHLDDDKDQLKYALIGMILSTPRVLRRGTSQAVQLANAGYSRVSGLLRPVTGSGLLRPINGRLDEMVARGEQIVRDWIDTGRRGEKTSQELVQQTTDEVVGELVKNVASRTDVKEIVQQQGMGMADELSEELQGRAAAADTILERIVFLLLPGKKADTTPTLLIPVRDEQEQARAKKRVSK